MHPTSAQEAPTEALSLLTLLVRALVDEPAVVAIDLVGEASVACVFEVHVAGEDVRRLIGRKGNTADALRAVLTNLGAKAGRRFSMEIIEPTSSWWRPGPRDGAPAPLSPEAPPAAQVGALINLVVRGLVDLPDEVVVQTVQGGQSTIFEVACHPEDVPRLIGQRGRTADALRTLLSCLGSKLGRRFLLEILEPAGRRP